MEIADIVKKLEQTDGILNVRIIDSETLVDIRTEEERIVLSGGMEYENRALDECYYKDFILCAFCDGFIEEPEDITMVMMDYFGNITGNDVPKCRMKEYSERGDVIWMSENFILYPNARQQSESKIIILPRDFKTLGDRDGVKDVISFYPSVSSDLLLKGRFAIDGPPGMSTLIIAFDRM